MIEPKLYMNPTKNLIDPKFYMNRTNNLIEPQHTYKTKDRVTRTPLKTRGELMCYGRVDSSCSTSGTRRLGRDFVLK
jgi:hypothetical protein